MFQHIILGYICYQQQNNQIKYDKIVCIRIAKKFILIPNVSIIVLCSFYNIKKTFNS